MICESESAVRGWPRRNHSKGLCSAFKTIKERLKNHTGGENDGRRLAFVVIDEERSGDRVRGDNVMKLHETNNNIDKNIPAYKVRGTDLFFCDKYCTQNINEQREKSK